MIRLLLLCAVACSMQAQTLEGLWASETKFGPKLRGELTVVREKGGWRASIGGQERRGADLRFTFDGGEYRGRLVRNAIEGWWLQPSGETEDRQDPGGSGQPFATPTTLRSAGRNRFRGTVVPLDDQFTLYLKIFRNAEGTLIGAFRNPDQNAIGPSTQYRVIQNGDTLQFKAGDEVMEAKLAGDRIRIVWPDLGRTLELTRRTPEQAAHFFPRPPGEPKYVYRKPDALNDGWNTARASDTGLDEAALAAMVQTIVDSDPAVRRPSLIHSLLVAHKGKLVLEEYFFGHHRERPHDLRSAGKTFSSILLGVAMRARVKLSPESRIVEVMKERGPFANDDPRKAKITLAHLMTHTPGLACNDNDENSPGNEGTLWQQEAQPDWWKYTLDLPMAHEPGTRYAYCSANINLVGGALTTATRTWLPELFDRTIAKPLQFGRYHWNLTPAGEGYLGGGAFMRPRDLLKIGQTFLGGGVWNGRRIVDESWVAESTKARFEITPATTGLTEEEFGNFYGGGMDAYAWHLGSLTAAGRTYPTYAATGNGGQVLLVVPDLDLTAVFTGGNYMYGGIWGRWGQEYIGGHVIPAIRK